MSQVIVITGASSGIGRATARRFARPGAKLALVARNRDGLDAASREVREAGGAAMAFPADVADPDAVEAVAAATEEALGPIDIWINVAMTTVFAFFEDVEPDEFRRATDVTYHGSVWGMRAALRRMAGRDRGTIVQVGSAMAYRGIPLQAPYCGAKHALQGVFESLRTELRHMHSKVNLTTVHLPGVNTPQFEHCRDKFGNRSQPVPPVYQPEVAADAIHWAAHHRRREVYVGIPTVYTIWGNKVAPWLAERYLARTAVGGQLSDAQKAPDRQDNLFEPPAGDPGAHGPYDDRAHARSIQLWVTTHRRGLLAGLATAGGAGLLARAAR
ncbi:MAG TPA: SDR family oxidoreductase [Solirubrobacteraceae bacterium]|jgi:NAD(P)-dependent dehydrogenase (short-subunit alcohol dehydrogenase family)|nr:SDR family oxidoreductase [Solirubrobacteraceae bacterium]